MHKRGSRTKLGTGEKGQRKGNSETPAGHKQEEEASRVPTALEFCGWVTAACLTEYKQNSVST